MTPEDEGVKRIFQGVICRLLGGAGPRGNQTFALLLPPSLRLVPALLAGPTTACAHRQSLVELVQQSQASLGAAACGPRQEAGLRIKLRQRHAGPFICQLVEAHAVVLRQQPQPMVYFPPKIPYTG